MCGLTAAELECIRETVNDTLTDTCDIQTQAETADGAGGVVITYTTALTNVPCRVTSAATNSQQQERIIADVLRGRMGYYITLPALTPITLESRVVQGGRTFEVVLQPHPTTDEVARRTLCVLVEGI